ncbi:MAG: hypothetical protein ABI664_10855 [bacterium]
MTRSAIRVVIVAGAALLHVSAGCAQQPAATGSKPTTTPATPAAASADTTGTGLVPAGFGTLRQDAIAIPLQLPGVLVKLTPLDESVIRTLSPDSYRAFRELAESKRPAIARLASQHGLLRGSLWHVSFYGLAPDARFSPLELTLTVAGRDYRPVEILPLSTGFGEQRLQPRETQTALYLFDDALDINQPLIVSLGSDRNESWSGRLKVIEQERVLIRSRANK